MDRYFEGSGREVAGLAEEATGDEWAGNGGGIVEDEY